jgi:ribosomal protein S18 acetylase RimI-like enzyme
MNQLWRSYLRYLTGRSQTGAIRALPGAEALWVNSDLAFCNGTFLDAPIATAQDLETAFAAAVADAQHHALPWGVFTYDPYLITLSEAAQNAAGAAQGLTRLLTLDVMTAQVSHLTARPQPALEFRRVETPSQALTVLQLNVLAYDMPAAIADSAQASQAFLTNPAREFAYLAYAGGTPVSTASVIEVDGWLYVALVATHPAHRQRGYAEAVMRHALAESSRALQIDRTSLDATAMGAPIYARMGYQHTGESWGMWVAPH